MAHRGLDPPLAKQTESSKYEHGQARDPEDDYTNVLGSSRLSVRTRCPTTAAAEYHQP